MDKLYVYRVCCALLERCIFYMQGISLTVRLICFSLFLFCSLPAQQWHDCLGVLTDETFPLGETGATFTFHFEDGTEQRVEGLGYFARGTS